MTAHTVVKLDSDEQRAAEAIIRECVKDVVRLLHVRLRSVRVKAGPKKALAETEYFQLIALMALCFRALENYPEDIQIEIDHHALTLAGLMARSAA